MKIQDWISFDDMMPDEGQLCIVCDNEATHTMRFGKHDENNQFGYDRPKLFKLFNPKLKYWVPIPEHPCSDGYWENNENPSVKLKDYIELTQFSTKRILA